MKRKMFILIVTVIVPCCWALADGPGGPGGGSNGNGGPSGYGGIPVGGSAPIDGGLYFYMILGSLYACFKSPQNNNVEKKLELED